MFLFKNNHRILSQGYSKREELCMQVAFFPGCIVDTLYPEVGKAAVRVLEKVGCTLTLPHQQICCGQPLFNSGYAARSLPVIKKIIDAYAEYETIVFLSGSCLSAVVDDYPDLLTRAPEYKEKLDTLVAHSHEFSDFLVNDLQLTNVGATLNASIVYHRSCHLTRMLKIEKEPLALLSKVKGLTILELEHAERCCGFGGTFSVKEPKISGAMVREKCKTIDQSGADIVCAADQACVMNIDGALQRMYKERSIKRPIRAMHLAEILASE